MVGLKNFQNTIEEIKEKADIVQIIGQYVALEKQGSSYIGLCPFHNDNHPSMSVSPTKKIFKCFSCNASGNVVSFVERYKNIPFIEALREVGETVGIKVESTKTEIEQNKNKKYYTLMNDASSFYRFYLRNTEEGKEALAYLAGRHLSDEIIQHFEIGLSGSDQDDLFQAMTEKGHLALDMVDCGLIRLKDKYFDVFRKRIMFPLHDLRGNVVGFSGRKYLLNHDEAKYVNSNENVIFKKSQILYHYHEANQDIKKNDHVFLFEGFLDVIAAYRAGINHSVASMGTALTIEQIRAMKRLTSHVTICYDGDDPGIEATKRAILMCVQEEMEVRVVFLPDGKDPDDYINQFGEKALYDILQNQASNGMDFLYSQAKKNLIKDDLNNMEQFKKSIFSYLNFFHSHILIESYLKKLASELNLSVDNIFSDYQELITQAPVASFIEVDLPALETKKITKPNFDRKFTIIQEQLIYLALKEPQLFDEIFRGFNYCFVSPSHQSLMVHLCEVKNDLSNSEWIEKTIPAELMQLYHDICHIYPIPAKEKWGRYLEDFKMYQVYKAKNIHQEDCKNREITAKDLSIQTQLKKKQIKMKFKKGE